MVITVFRSRVKPEAEEEYARWAARMGELARQMPGYISHKGFVAEDGERVTIVEFESEQAQRAWRCIPNTWRRRKKDARTFMSNTGYRSARCSVTASFQTTEPRLCPGGDFRVFGKE
jgi:heme-degrading monooxygenase HmoA